MVWWYVIRERSCLGANPDAERWSDIESVTSFSRSDVLQSTYSTRCFVIRDPGRLPSWHMSTNILKLHQHSFFRPPFLHTSVDILAPRYLLEPDPWSQYGRTGKRHHQQGHPGPWGLRYAVQASSHPFHGMPNNHKNRKTLLRPVILTF